MTFREWLNEEIRRLEMERRIIDRVDDDSNYYDYLSGAMDYLEDAGKEFDRRLRVATLEDLATSTGTIWIEEEQGDE